MGSNKSKMEMLEERVRSGLKERTALIGPYRHILELCNCP